jgi:two-component system response regulator NreC
VPIATKPELAYRSQPRGEDRPISVRLLVVDDHPVVRAGLRWLLKGDDRLSVVGEASTAGDAVREARAVQPDVVILDVHLAAGDGISAIPALLHERPQARILVFSDHSAPSLLRAAFAAGASGYLVKDAGERELITAIDEIAGGGRYVHPSLGARLVAAEEEAAMAQAAPLSPRERQVLRLLALGHTNQEIARTLAISVRTVETHRTRIMHKLGVETRAALVGYALAEGVIQAR